MRKLIAALPPLSAVILLAGAAQATDGSPMNRGLDQSPAIAKSTGGLLIAGAGGSAPESAGENMPPDKNKPTGEREPTAKKKPKAKKQVGNAKNNVLNGTKGPDIMSGGPGNDVFGFNYFPNNPSINTLDDGERITDYEFGERIVIRGVRIEDDKDIKVVYDAKKNETRIEIDLPHKNDKFEIDGKVHKTIILTGDKRGTLNIDIPCCVSKSTEIWIYNEKAAKAAKAARIKAVREARKKAKEAKEAKEKARKKARKKAKKKVSRKRRVKRSRVKRRPATTHRPTSRRIQRNRYPADDDPLSGGGGD